MKICVLGQSIPPRRRHGREFLVSVGDVETLLECRVSGVPPHFVPAAIVARGREQPLGCGFGVGCGSRFFATLNVREESLPAAAAEGRLD